MAHAIVTPTKRLPRNPIASSSWLRALGATSLQAFCTKCGATRMLDLHEKKWPRLDVRPDSDLNRNITGHIKVVFCD
jgi:hypothetical protein